MASMYINGKKYSGSNWYDLKISHSIEDREDAVPSSALLASVDAQIKEKIQEYTSLLDFPVTGKEGVIYVDKTNNAIYRWDDEQVKFYCIGSDCHTIDVIDGSF